MKIILSLAFLFFGCLGIAQDQQSTIEHLIQSEAFGKERKVYVHLPARYHKQSVDTFMVVYVLDAQSKQYWNMAIGNIEYLVNNYQVVPMIAVGIHSDRRQTEFIPKAKKPSKKRQWEGQAHLLQKRLREEVFPLIQKNYRVNHLKAIVGHSRGGAFIAHTLFSEHRDLFDAYIGISPGLEYLDKQILKDASTFLQSQKPIRKFLYCSIGDVGTIDQHFGPHVAHLDSLIQNYPNPTLAFNRDFFPGTDHWSTVIPAWNMGLLKMSRHFCVDQKMIEDFSQDQSQNILDHIANFYQHQNQHFGQSLQPSIRSLRYYGNAFRERSNYEVAEAMYFWALRRAPQNWKVHRSIARLYQHQENYTDAKAGFQKALECLILQKDQMDQEDFRHTKEALENAIQSMEDKSN